ncbi:MAG: FtsQ-type POTRA domain-containing protein [Lachnospiraceae bacterium]|nr:FtsQ-type POTRA domain-containing protein [Lachnospiraceae bacterium]MBO5145906.1 FtsQ-type POTRA domain-containing protein [Lachnospiraceae bacterium]
MKKKAEEKAKRITKKSGSTIAKMPDTRLKVRIIIALGIINVLLLASYFVLTHYTVKNVQVDGNKHYSAEEIKAMIMTGYFGDNSLYLSLKYKNKDIEGVPFIETMDVVVQSNDTIRIIVYEKALAGYVQYLGRYMYFDNEGVIVEASKVTTKGIPQVTGLKFDHVVLYEKLPVENDQIFQNILTITKLLNKYDVICDKIQFDSNYNVTLGYDSVKVNIGPLENLDEKLMQLPKILPSLEGKKGTLDLQNYTADRKSITFEREN